MRQGKFHITENIPLARDIMSLSLEGDTGAIVRPGQFVNIQVEGCFLRRPLSVCDWDDGSLTLVYRIAGRGTELLAKMKKGSLDVLTGLGNGFNTALSGDRPAAHQRWPGLYSPVCLGKEPDKRGEESSGDPGLCLKGAGCLCG